MATQHRLRSTGSALVALSLLTLLSLLAAPLSAEELVAVRAGRILRDIRDVRDHRGTLPAAESAARFLRRHAKLLGLAAGAELRPHAPLALADGGSVVRFAQSFGGIPVVGGGASVRLDGHGRVLRVHAYTAPPPPTLVPAQSPPAVLVRIAASHAPHHAAEASERFLRLVVLPFAGGSHLAYELAPPASLLYLEALRLYVDAANGDLLRRDNRVRSLHQGKVFARDPISTPTLETVGLFGIGAGATSLSGDLVDSRNCIDEHALTTVTFAGITLGIHLCSEVATALPDGNGDFLYDRPAQDTAPEDPFAEVQVFYHAIKAYRFFQGLGLTLLDQRPLRTVANFRAPVDLGSGDYNLAEVIDPMGPLYPLDNAFFVPGDEFAGITDRPYDSLVFGQGRKVDLGYDGDVVYHEFTHAVVDTVAGLGGFSADEQGLDSSTGALNEAYSDLFACAITSDPNFSIYSGPGNGQPTRDLETTMRCPDHLQGESHHDGRPWSAALWTIRTQVVDPGVDGLLYAALASLPPDADYDAAAVATLDELGRSADPGAVSKATAALAAHGLPGCQRVLDYNAPRARLDSEGTAAMGLAPYVPGYLQFRYQASTAIEPFAVTFRRGSRSLQLGDLLGSPPDFRLLLRRADQPLRFTYTAAQVTSNADLEVPIAEIADGSYRGDVGRLEAGVYHMMIVNAGGQGGRLTQIKLGQVAPLPPADGTAADGGGRRDAAAADRPPLAADAAVDAAAPAADGGLGGDRVSTPDQGAAAGGGGCALAAGAGKQRDGSRWPARGLAPMLALAIVLALAGSRRRGSQHPR